MNRAFTIFTLSRSVASPGTSGFSGSVPFQLMMFMGVDLLGSWCGKGSGRAVFEAACERCAAAFGGRFGRSTHRWGAVGGDAVIRLFTGLAPRREAGGR
ncbi:hypothetical protein GCM10010398_50940 [Streptomyces fimbriatus]